MRKALFLTAYNRLSYLQQVLHTWESVVGVEEWDMVAMIEPSDLSHQIVEEFEEFSRKTKFRRFSIQVNPQVYGVLHHPWVGFENLFSTNLQGNYDFVVRAEDDIIVSNDVLEYFSWAAKKFKLDPSVATVHAFSEAEGSARDVELISKFSPLMWGTWRDRWQELLSPTWDHDYSTFNLRPGNQSGWDWNINTRLLPRLGLTSVCPVVSRTNNIGVVGTHGTPGNFLHLEDFVQHRNTPAYRLVDSRNHD